jgi:hypothetical protein
MYLTVTPAKAGVHRLGDPARLTAAYEKAEPANAASCPSRFAASRSEAFACVGLARLRRRARRSDAPNSPPSATLTAKIVVGPRERKAATRLMSNGLRPFGLGRSGGGQKRKADEASSRCW